MAVCVDFSGVPEAVMALLAAAEMRRRFSVPPAGLAFVADLLESAIVVGAEVAEWPTMNRFLVCVVSSGGVSALVLVIAVRGGMAVEVGRG
jgi:hypothetical protein